MIPPADVASSSADDEAALQMPMVETVSSQDQIQEAIYTCKFPGCTRQYASTDGVRKHCRKSHPEWLRDVDLEKANSGCRWAAYCTRQAITDGSDPRITPVGCKRAREIMADGGILPPIVGNGAALLKERSERQRSADNHSNSSSQANTGAYGMAMDGKSYLQVGRLNAERQASSENVLPPEMVAVPADLSSPLPANSSNLTPNAQARQRLGEIADGESSALTGSANNSLCPDSIAAPPPQPTGFFSAWGMPPLKRGISLADAREASVLNGGLPHEVICPPAEEKTADVESQMGTPLGLATPSSFLDSIIA